MPWVERERWAAGALASAASAVMVAPAVVASVIEEKGGMPPLCLEQTAGRTQARDTVAREVICARRRLSSEVAIDGAERFRGGPEVTSPRIRWLISLIAWKRCFPGA